MSRSRLAVAAELAALVGTVCMAVSLLVQLLK
jgi:hypothetical protein